MRDGDVLRAGFPGRAAHVKISCVFLSQIMESRQIEHSSCGNINIAFSTLLSPFFQRICTDLTGQFLSDGPELMIKK